MEMIDQQSKEVGTRLVMLRMQRGIPQFKVAEMLGISAPSLCAWETGKHQASYSGLTWYAEYFHVSLDWILLGKKMPYPDKDESLPVLNDNLSKDEIESLRQLIAERNQQ